MKKVTNEVFVLLRDDKVIGVFSSYAKAYNEMKKMLTLSHDSIWQSLCDCEKHSFATSKAFWSIYDKKLDANPYTD